MRVNRLSVVLFLLSRLIKLFRLQAEKPNETFIGLIVHSVVNIPRMIFGVSAFICHRTSRKHRKVSHHAMLQYIYIFTYKHRDILSAQLPLFK